MGRTAAILVARLVFAACFIMAASFKFIDMPSTAGAIEAAGFPVPLALAWIAAFFETALVLAFVTGAWFSEAALFAAAYLVFLAFAFHGPAHWSGNQMEFGLFVDHFTFMAGLLFAAVHGPGQKLAVRKGYIWQSSSRARDGARHNRVVQSQGTIDDPDHYSI